MVKKNCKLGICGFTLIELIIVIMIVSISATFISTSYVISKRRADLNLAADQIVSSLKENRSTVKSGFREKFEEVGEEGETKVTYGDPKCYGVRFDKIEGIFNIQTPYVNGECVKEEIDPYESISEGFELNIQEIRIATGSAFSQVDLLFAPPTGEIVLLSENLIYEQRDLEIDLYAYNSDDERNHRYIQVDTVSGRMGVSYGHDQNTDSK